MHSSMSSLADAPNLVGFFSYSREDDEDCGGKLSKLESAFKRNCAANSVASRQISDYQDKTAIAQGELWEDEIKSAVQVNMPRYIGLLLTL